MAIYHLSAKIIGRADGKSAVAAAAYRSGQELHDERTGTTHKFGRAERVAHTEILAPADAPSWVRDRGRLWNSVEEKERRKDSQLAREFELALPIELTLEQQVALLRGWVQEEFVAHGLTADVCVHGVGGDNPHAHIMTSMRAISAEGWDAKKYRLFEDRSYLERWRESWAIHANCALERAGVDARIDHRSLADQDADLPEDLRREPTKKLGPAGNRPTSDRYQENAARRARNTERIRRLKEMAATVAKKAATTVARTSSRLAAKARDLAQARPKSAAGSAASGSTPRLLSRGPQSTLGSAPAMTPSRHVPQGPQGAAVGSAPTKPVSHGPGTSSSATPRPQVSASSSTSPPASWSPAEIAWWQQGKGKGID